jgi:hypothetical protein
MGLKIYNKGALIVILLLVLSFFVYCLIEGSELLMWPIIKDPYLPLGTFIGWYVLAVIPFLILSLMEWLGAKKQLLSFYTLGKVGLWMGLLWGLVSFGLSGNFSFSFRGGIYPEIWRVYTILVVVLPLLGLLLFGLAELFRWIMRFFNQEKP